MRCHVTIQVRNRITQKGEVITSSSFKKQLLVNSKHATAAVKKRKIKDKQQDSNARLL